ncbi:hypothetical protein BDW68DRAFT_164491 [Aspergillus falconensis]
MNLYPGRSFFFVFLTLGLVMPQNILLIQNSLYLLIRVPSSSELFCDSIAYVDYVICCHVFWCFLFSCVFLIQLIG